VLLTATGPLFLAGVVLHPHAPDAHSMAQVAYTQTGEVEWWPAHLLLLASYVAFAAFLFGISRLDGLAASARQVLDVARPVAAFCVLAMLVHLMLPLGRESVASSHQGWALWTKDAAETADGLWAVCVAAVAWALGRAGLAGNRITAALGVVGGLGFALFSFLVPLTGVVVSMDFTRSLVTVVPAFGLLIVAWAVFAGGAELVRTPVALADDAPG